MRSLLTSVRWVSPAKELRKARRLFDRPGHLQLFPVHHAVLPVRCGGTLVQDIAVFHPLLEDVRPGARRLRLVAISPSLSHCALLNIITFEALE